MIIGLVEEMSSQDVAHLSDWADHHARTVPNPTWKRAYALIREGCDLLLRRRAMTDEWVTKDFVKPISKLYNPHVHTVMPDGSAPSCIICHPDLLAVEKESVPNLNNTNGPHIAR
jgi:hypothetical protein